VGHRTGLEECRKSRPPLGFVTRTVQPVTSRYTDYATPVVKCLFVALGIQHAQGLRRIAIYGLSDSTIFLPTISLKAQFSQNKVIEHKMCALIFPANFVRNILHPKKK